MPRPLSLRDSDTPQRTGSLIPPCIKCQRVDRVEEEEQSGSSARWFLCTRCGVRYAAVPRAGTGTPVRR
jgi:hypothetical protein